MPVAPDATPAAPPAPSNPLLDFSAADLFAAYQRGDYADMSRRFLAVLNHLKDMPGEPACEGRSIRDAWRQKIMRWSLINHVAAAFAAFVRSSPPGQPNVTTISGQASGAKAA